MDVPTMPGPILLPVANQTGLPAEPAVRPAVRRADVPGRRAQPDQQLGHRDRACVSIAAAMHVSVGHASILISSLYLTSVIAQPTAGRLAEELGPRRVFLAGIAIVFIGGLVGGSAQNLPTLVVARVLIGLARRPATRRPCC